MISSEGIIATDITSKFKASAETLEPGDIIKDGHFTLFESVGALEIMDPKMDSGCLAPGETLDEEYDVTRPLLPAEVLGIMDQLLCLEMAWHLGYPLSQTLLTNVYIEALLNPEPKTIEEADFVRPSSGSERGVNAPPRDPMLTVLRAYCLGLIKTCWYVVDRIRYEHYYEEEDFVTNNYNRSLLESISRDEIRDEIMAARTLVHELRHDLRHSITDEMSQALNFRLELRAAFLRAIELSELRSNPESLSLPWSQMQAVWEPIHKSRHLGVPVPEAFSTKIQRRLASTMPPRPIVQLSFEETYEHFKKFFADGIEVLRVLNYSDSQSLLNFVLAFQSQKPQPLVYVRTMLQNFLFKDMIILGRLSIRHVLDDDLALVCMPASPLMDPANDIVEAPQDPRFAIAHQMESFRQRAAQSYLDIFRALCQNRCRVRRTLCHSIQDWEAVQMNAEDIDNLLHVQIDEVPLRYVSSSVIGVNPEPSYSLPLSSWAYLYKLRLMEWIVQIGFELETYQPDELAGMYWYLSYLAKNRAEHVERIQAFVYHQREQCAQRQRAGKFSFNGLSFAQAEAQFTRCLRFLHQQILDAAVTWEMGDILCSLYTIAQREKLIVPPPRPYSTDELRYEIRMKPFVNIILPELPPFDSFQKSVKQPGTSTEELLEYVDRAVASAKKGYDALSRMNERDSFTATAGSLSHKRWVEKTKNSYKSAIAAGIAGTALKEAIAEVRKRREEEGKEVVNEDGGVEVFGLKDRLGVKIEVPKPDEGYHEWWIVPKIIVKKMGEAGGKGALPSAAAGVDGRR